MHPKTIIINRKTTNIITITIKILGIILNQVNHQTVGRKTMDGIIIKIPKTMYGIISRSLKTVGGIISRSLKTMDGIISKTLGTNRTHGINRAVRKMLVHKTIGINLRMVVHRIPGTSLKTQDLKITGTQETTKITWTKTCPHHPAPQLQSRLLKTNKF